MSGVARVVTHMECRSILRQCERYRSERREWRCRQLSRWTVRLVAMQNASDPCDPFGVSQGQRAAERNGRSAISKAFRSASLQSIVFPPNSSAPIYSEHMHRLAIYKPKAEYGTMRK